MSRQQPWKLPLNTDVVLCSYYTNNTFIIQQAVNSLNFLLLKYGFGVGKRIETSM